MRRAISGRHRPSFISYLRHNVRTTFDFSERAEAMVTLVLIFFSALIATGGSLAAPGLSERLETWNAQAAIGITIFVVFQFGLFTPFRMWQDAVWVRNIEAILDRLWDHHDEGVKLFNAHYEPAEAGEMPRNLSQDIQNRWIAEWLTTKEAWESRTSITLEELHQLEARRFKNVVTTGPVIEGLNHFHTHHLGMVYRKLERLSETIARHQPALFPG